jgi:hypothetical protein
MKTNRLLPEFRLKMRELIQGFIEHCEISQTLIGRIERSVQFGGRKYGFPTFTVYGPPQPGLETRFLNLIGNNDADDAVAAETLLQLIERLVLQPHIAAGQVLRILPVTNPVALELGPDMADEANPVEIAQLENVVDQFRQQPADGTIEIALSRRDHLTLTVSGPTLVLEAVSAAEDALRRLRSEDSIEALTIVAGHHRPDGPWHLRLEIPRDWPVALSVHWTSQVLVVFFRNHLEKLLHQTAPALTWAE